MENARNNRLRPQIGKVEFPRKSALRLALRQFAGLALTLACAALLTAVSLPRNSLGYRVYNLGGTPCRWNVAALASGTVVWDVGPGAPDMVRQAMLLATQEWSVATGGTLQFAEGPGGIRVEWDADGSRIPDPLFLAYATFTAAGDGRIASALIVINASDYTWRRGGNGGMGAYVDGKREAPLDSVVLHELGHALGLDHSDAAPEALVGQSSPSDLPTMNSVIYPGAQTLHVDDDAGIQSLYGGTRAPQTTPEASPLTIVASRVKGRAPLNVTFTELTRSRKTAWDFSDGVALTGAKARHRFMTPGTYTVTARNEGQRGTVVVEVEARPRKTRANTR
jgi:hypothetical protein